MFTQPFPWISGQSHFHCLSKKYILSIMLTSGTAWRYFVALRLSQDGWCGYIVLKDLQEQPWCHQFCHSGLLYCPDASLDQAPAQKDCATWAFSSPMGKLPWLTRHYWLDQQISDHKSVVFQKHIHKLWIQGHLSQPSHYSRLMSGWSNTYKGNVHAHFNRWNKGDALDRKGLNLWYMKPRCYGKSSGSLNPPTWDDDSSTTGFKVSYTR